MPEIDPTALRRTPDGSWRPSEPLPGTDEFTVEVSGSGPWTWTVRVGETNVASGRARTRIGLRIAIWRARHPALRAEGA